MVAKMELVRFLTWVLIYYFALNSGETPLHTVLKEAHVCVCVCVHMYRFGCGCATQSVCSLLHSTGKKMQ